MKENGYDTYTLQSLSEKAVRAYFLNESKNGKILLAQMLPLMNSTPIDFQALQLVHKYGGYWVYKIPAAWSLSGHINTEYQGSSQESLMVNWPRSKY